MLFLDEYAAANDGDWDWVGGHVSFLLWDDGMDELIALVSIYVKQRYNRSTSYILEYIIEDVFSGRLELTDTWLKSKGMSRCPSFCARDLPLHG